MKILYTGEIRRGKDGKFIIDDNKGNWIEVTEIQLSLYLGSLFGAVVEHMRLKEFNGTMFIDVKTDGEFRKEAEND